MMLGGAVSLGEQKMPLVLYNRRNSNTGRWQKVYIHENNANLKSPIYT